MAETIVINNSLSAEEKYIGLSKQLRNLLNKNENLISNLANFTALLKQTFEKISWVGFYLFDGNELYLGPFQGKVACTIIQFGKGVCGTSAQRKETIIVPDVNQFSGHIFCDPDSKSEIVVPILKNDNLFGVLDLDSSSLNSFDETDKKYLEEFINFLSAEII
ncbi:MAG: GAF domain-containing protein [Ignavibacteriaceae bacterium]